MFKYSYTYIHETDTITAEEIKETVQMIVDLFDNDKFIKLDIREMKDENL